MGEEESLNKELSLHEETPVEEQRGQHTTEDLVNLKLKDYRYMFEKISEKGEGRRDMTCCFRKDRIWVSTGP